MQYLLTIDDAAREYLLIIVQDGVIRAAAKLPDLDPKRDADQYAKARAALLTGAALLADLSPSRLEVAPVAPTELGRDELDTGQARRCVHGIDFAEPCGHCNPPPLD